MGPMEIVIFHNPVSPLFCIQPNWILITRGVCNIFPVSNEIVYAVIHYYDPRELNPKMAAPFKFADWHYEAIQLMARSGCSLKQAATELAVPVTNEECNLISRRASFVRLLWSSRHQYFAELASDPNFKKDTLVGKFLSLAQKLEEEGQHDKSAEVLFKAAKAMGWIGPESTVSVFGELSQRDLDAIRDKVKSGSIQPKAN